MLRLKHLTTFSPLREGEGVGGGGGDPWYHGKADAATIGYLQARGWDKDPVHAALEAGKAHREAEKMLGAPAADIVRLPKKEDSAGWQGVYERLGKPKDVKEYDFASVKTKAGTPLPDPLVEKLRATAASLNLPKDQAAALGKSVLDLVETADAAAVAERESNIAKEKDKLADNWKGNFEQNMLIARRTAVTLGMSEEQITALEKTGGYASVMNMLRQLGTMIGEDKFIANDKSGGPRIMTKEMAAAKIAELKADTAWRDRYLAGGTAEMREMQDLIAIQHA